MECKANRHCHMHYIAEVEDLAFVNTMPQVLKSVLLSTSEDMKHAFFKLGGRGGRGTCTGIDASSPFLS